MRLRIAFLVSFSVSLGLVASTSRAQWMYPGGYGGYGMSRWGADPAAGYMAGLGAYARGQGVYALQKAKADAINVETMVKWNKALRARQAALREEKRQKAIQQEIHREQRVAEMDLKDGTTLNNLLLQIFDADPGVVRSARVKAPISPAAIREIPFEWDSEAIAICLDQLTGQGSLPPVLMRPTFLEERNALHAAVQPALTEDAKGDVAPATRKHIDEVVAAFRARFLKETPDFDPGYQDALEYFTTLASLSRLLSDPSMKAFLEQLDDNHERTVGDLVAFMNAYNLRFGPTTSDRQLEIYARLVPALATIREQAVSGGAAPSTPDRTGEGLRAAGRQAFKGMSWDELEAHRNVK